MGVVGDNRTNDEGVEDGLPCWIGYPDGDVDWYPWTAKCGGGLICVSVCRSAFVGLVGLRPEAWTQIMTATGQTEPRLPWMQ